MYKLLETRSNGQRMFLCDNGYGLSVIPQRDYMTGDIVSTSFETITINPAGNMLHDSVRTYVSEEHVQNYLVGLAILG